MTAGESSEGDLKRLWKIYAPRAAGIYSSKHVLASVVTTIDSE